MRESIAIKTERVATYTRPVAGTFR